MDLSKKTFLDLIKASQSKKFCFVLDYDGTLTPLVPDPFSAFLTQEQKNSLNILAETENTLVAIMTGRSLANLKLMLNAGLNKKIILLGTHGAEINEEVKESPYKSELLKIRDQFAAEPYLLIEEKSLALAIHYKEHPEPTTIINKLQEEADKHQDQFRVQRGHGVFEFLPKGINKGNGIHYLQKEYPDYFKIFFGDDLTDNYGFAAINKIGGLSIQVSERLKEHEAKYLIKGVSDVYDFISGYAEMMNGTR